MKRKKQKRATDAFKIRTAQSEQERHDIAYWRRVLTPLERWMDEWRGQSAILKRLAPQAPEESREQLRAVISQAQCELQRLFLETVEKLDANGLRQLARHMEEQTLDCRAKGEVGNRWRAQLLTLKQIHPYGFSLSTLAKMIHYPGELSTLDDIAKDVGFPLQNTPTGRPKKATSKQ